MWSDNLELRNEQGDVLSPVADFIVGEPEEEYGRSYQPLTVTVELGWVRPGHQITVFDLTANKPVVTFMAEQVRMQVAGEQFMRIDGRRYFKASPSD